MSSASLLLLSEGCSVISDTVSWSSRQARMGAALLEAARGPVSKVLQEIQAEQVSSDSKLSFPGKKKT